MQGSVLMFLSALLVFATTMLTYRVVQGRWSLLTQPIIWFYASWLVGLGMLSLPLFDYYESFGFESGAYIIGVLFAFSTGAVLALFVGQSEKNGVKQTSVPAPREPPLRLIQLLLLAGLAGTALLIANAVLSGSLSLSERMNMDNAAMIRLDFMGATESKIGPLYGPANMASSLGGLGISMAMYLVGARFSLARRQLMLGVGLLLALNLFGALFAFGSRMFGVFAIALAFLGFVQGRWSIGERIVTISMGIRGALLTGIAALLTLTSLWFASTYFLEKRVADQSPSLLLFRTHRAVLSQEVHENTYNTRSLQYLLFSASYATTPVATLTFYLDLPDSRTPGPFFGEYNFPPIARWIRRLAFSANPISWELARYEIFKPLADINFGTNVWSTMIRDLIADFGKGGALVFVLMLGYFSQRMTDSQARSPSPYRAAVVVYLQLILLFSGLISLLFMPQIHWALYLAVFLVLFGRYKSHKPVKASNQRGA